MEDSLSGQLEYLFSDFVMKYDNIVEGFLVGRLGKKLSREDRDDLKQEIWLKVWRALPEYQNQGSPASWLKAITENTGLDLVKKKNPSKPNVLASEGKADPIESIQDPVDGEAAAKQRTLRAEESAALQKLPKGQRHVFTEYYINGNSIDDIANNLKKTKGTIKKQLFNARNKLKDILSQRGVSPADFPGRALMAGTINQEYEP